MPPSEVCWRVRRLLWQIYAKCMHRHWHARYLRHRSELAAAVDYLDAVRFYGLTEIKPADVPTPWRNGALEAADRLMRHRFRYLALGEIDLGETIRWNHEYKRGIDTPLVFGPWMDYRDSEAYGDFKYFWEVPRLQHLVLLAKAYYLTSKSKYADEIIQQLTQFRKEAPYLQGVNWTVPMEAGLRLLSLCWITMFLRPYLREHSEALDLIESMVCANTDYVVGNYSRYSSANNHLIGEAAGVFVASICFGYLRGMHRHREEAYRILCREMQEQHFPDGVNKEQAVHYQVFALHFFLLAGLLGDQNEQTFPVGYWKMFERSVEFVAALMGLDGHLPHIGDSDDGRAIVLSVASENDAATILATSAIRFRRSDFGEKAGECDEACFWLLGGKAMDTFSQLPVEPHASKSPSRFEHGGYHILSGAGQSRLRVVFDCGPLGFGSISAHGHADALSFILTMDGQEVFIDPGTYIYDCRSRFRDYFRSTAAHNTVVVDGQDQSKMAGPFLWRDKATAVFEGRQTDASCDRVTGSHDGYRRLQDPVVHRRSIEIDKETEAITIVDLLRANSSHQAVMNFHLAPDWEVELLDRNRFRLNKGTGLLELAIDKNLTCEVLRGSESPLAGWASPAYDVKMPTSTIVCRGDFVGNCRFTTRIETVSFLVSRGKVEQGASG